MKILVMILVLSISVFAVEAVKKDSTIKAQPKKIAVTAQQKVVVQLPQKATEFDNIQLGYKKQLVEIEKKKEDQKAALAKLEKETTSSDVKSDSIYNAAKIALKVVYDKEMAKIVVQEQDIKAAKEKLDASYQDALKAIEETKKTK